MELSYIPIRDRANFGQLQFPTLADKTPTISTLKDMREEDVSVPIRKRRTKRLSDANRRMDAKLGATSEFRKVRHNLSYKPILDVLGEDFPLHPEYLYVINIILEYYNVQITDLLEFIAIKELLSGDTASGTSFSKRMFNTSTTACLAMLMYFLYEQYKCNPTVLMQMFGMTVVRLRTIMEQFGRQYDNSSAVRADYAAIHGRLMMLQP